MKNKQLQRLATIYENKYSVKLKPEEVFEINQNIIGYAYTLIKIKKRLENERKQTISSNH